MINPQYVDGYIQIVVDDVMLSFSKEDLPLACQIFRFSEITDLTNKDMLEIADKLVLIENHLEKLKE